MGWKSILGLGALALAAACQSSGAACCEGDFMGGYVVAECGERFCVGNNAYQCVSEGNAIEDGICGGELDAGPGFDSGPAPTASICENTCVWANDGECDDGGPGSLFSECALGTDCADCGPRDPLAPGCACDTSSSCQTGCACDDDCRATGTLRVGNVSTTTTIRAIYSGPCGGASGDRLLRSNETIRPGTSLDIELEVGCHDVDGATSPFADRVHTLNGLTITEGGVTRAELEAP